MKHSKSKTNKKIDQTRRSFLKKSAYAALLGSSASAFNGKLTMMNAALAAPSGGYAGLDDYKALVCVFLYGGSDSFNLFVPTAGEVYDKYATARAALALTPSQLIDDSASGRAASLRFHPNLSNIRDSYRDGNLAVVRNVGNLIEPATRTTISNNSTRIPIDLFAHNSQQEQVLKSYSSKPAGTVSAGWGGRMADLLVEAELENKTALPPSFSVNNSNFFLPGEITTPISVNPVNGPSLLQYLDKTRSASNTNREIALDSILNLPRNNLIEDFAASSYINARNSSRDLSSVIADSTDLAVPWNSSNPLDVQLRMVARMIEGHQRLGKSRQVFFVGLGGWDTHKDQLLRFNTLTSQLNEGLYNFQTALEAIELENKVTTFTASDFGRTLSLNSSGTDHGWGGHYLVMGGAVNGGQMYGDWPDYEIGSQDDLGLGRIIPKISTNQYGGALARWMGVCDDDLVNVVFPDLNNFGYGPGSYSLGSLDGLFS